MPRAKAILQSEFPYQITARCINREWFFLPMRHVWHVFCDELTKVTKEEGLLVHNFVLMSNHFHLIARTPNANISPCMQKFMGRSSRRLTRDGNRINETFAGRHYKCVLDSHAYYLNAYKYNYRNPVTAQICTRVEDYPFSTLRGLLNPKELLVPVVEDFLFKEDPVRILEWLNTAPDPKKLEALRFGLQRPIFRSKKCRNTNSLIIRPDEII